MKVLTWSKWHNNTASEESKLTFALVSVCVRIVCNIELSVSEFLVTDCPAFIFLKIMQLNVLCIKYPLYETCHRTLRNNMRRPENLNAKVQHPAIQIIKIWTPAPCWQRLSNQPRIIILNVHIVLLPIAPIPSKDLGVSLTWFIQQQQQH
jgi:hypothetical protein